MKKLTSLYKERIMVPTFSCRRNVDATNLDAPVTIPQFTVTITLDIYTHDNNCFMLFYSVKKVYTVVPLKTLVPIIHCSVVNVKTFTETEPYIAFAAVHCSEFLYGLSSVMLASVCTNLTRLGLSRLF
jgi:hypothetical protein